MNDVDFSCKGYFSVIKNWCYHHVCNMHIPSMLQSQLALVDAHDNPGSLAQSLTELLFSRQEMAAEGVPPNPEKLAFNSSIVTNSMLYEQTSIKNTNCIRLMDLSPLPYISSHSIC